MRRARLRGIALGVALILGSALPAMAQDTLDRVKRAGAPAGAPHTPARVRKSGALVIGYRDTARPFSFKDDQGQPAGYSVDLCRQIAAAVQKSLGLAKLDLRFVPVTAANRVESVGKGTGEIECGTTPR